jgi:hypothetical protein
MGPSADAPAWKPLGELLVEQSWITPADLQEALEEQERTGRKLGQIVVESGFISVEGLTKVLLEQCGIDMSTEEGFGSGLRDELAKRGGRRGSEPVRFEFNVEPEPEKREKRKKEPKPEKQPKQELPKEPRRPERTSRRRFGRNRNREPLKRLEKLAKDFERQERELVETITSLRQMLRPVGD